MPLAEQSELSIGSSALEHLGGLVMPEDGRVQSGCKCIRLPVASVSQDALEGLASRSSYHAGSTLARSADRVARMAAALVKLEAEDAAKNGETGGELQRVVTFRKTATRRSKSDPGDVARSSQSTQEELGLPALGSERGLNSLLEFVPRFVQERCLDGTDMESLSDHRRVCVLFVVAHVQVILSFIYILAVLRVPVVLPGVGLTLFGSILAISCLSRASADARCCLLNICAHCAHRTHHTEQSSDRHQIRKEAAACCRSSHARCGHIRRSHTAGEILIVSQIRSFLKLMYKY